MDDGMEELAMEDTGGNKRTDKVYKPSSLRDQRKFQALKNVLTLKIV